MASMIFALAARGGLWAVSFGIAAKNSQIFETIGGLLDREIVRLYKPGLNFGEVSDPHSAALGRRVWLGGMVSRASSREVRGGNRQHV